MNFHCIRFLFCTPSPHAEEECMRLKPSVRYGMNNILILRNRGKQTGRNYPSVLSIRRRYGLLIDPINAIEGFNRQLRRVTKSKSVFPTDDSLLKMPHSSMMDITIKRTGKRRDWSVNHLQPEAFLSTGCPDSGMIFCLIFCIMKIRAGSKMLPAATIFYPCLHFTHNQR